MSVEHATLHSRRRDCPVCGAPSVQLPLFTSRRRSAVTCTDCGTKLERVLPGVAYYSLAFFTGIIMEASVFAMLLMAFFQKWLLIGGVIVGLVLLNLGVSAFLNSRTRVEYAEPKDARKDQPGRWYPQSPGD